ncbi:MAG TPA: helix-turn-helix domain-containing protein [Chloroflexia bacterium]|nr:helix-turn-helix domain-containing protein [Chloroflexia bacterium]
MPLVTIADVIHTVLAPLAGGYTLLAGAAGLDHEVTWPAMARPGSPIFPVLKPGELALAAGPSLAQLDPPAHLAALVDGLAERGAAGLILRGPIPAADQAAAVQAADRQQIPLLLVGAEIHLNDVERALTSLIRERRDDFYSRTAHLQEVQFQIAEAPPGGWDAGLELVVRTLATLAHAPAALTGPPPGLEIRYQALPPAAAGATLDGLRAGWPTVAQQALATWQAPSSLRNVRAAEPPVLLLAAAEGTALIAAPVLVRDRLAATLLLATPAPAAAIDQLTVSRAAGVCALELARSQAVAVAETRTEQRLRGDFLADLLNHTPGSGDEILLTRARALGVDLAPAYAVALLSLAPPPAGASALPDDADAAQWEAVVAGLSPAGRDGHVLVQVLAGRLAVLWALPVRPAAADPPGAPPERFVRLVDELCRQGASRGDRPAAAGTGRAYPGIGGAARSRQEAEQALWAAWHLFGGGRSCHYGALGIYRLLLPLRTAYRHEMHTFYEEALGPLERTLEASRTSQPAKLLETLEAFLEHGGNHSATAAALYLHRNTLSYRLRRIAEVSGLDLDDPAVRFRTQVALCVRRLL